MTRRVLIAAIAVAAVLRVDVGVEPAAWGASTTTLLLPASTAFSVLGRSCGGIQEQVLATGFDAESGYPTGDVYLQTRCGGSGRGGGYHTTTYSAWVGVTWDYTGAVVASDVLVAAPPDVAPTFSAVDSFGNEVQNQLNAVNVLPANCSVGNTTYCSYRAYLSLAADFLPFPRVTAVSVSSGPAAGGTSVTITGTGFTGATVVSFGDVAAASFVLNGDTSITASSPAASDGIIDVTVTTPGGTSPASAADRFKFIGAPAVSGISPDSGTVDGGTEVTITGMNLTDAIEVDFGETAAGFTVNDDSSITAIAPAAEAAEAVHVTVATIGGTSARSAADRFLYTTATGCSGACGSSIQCARLKGTLTGTLTISKCTPKSMANRRASLEVQTNGFIWKPSGETTIVSFEVSSPGQGACRAGSIEYDISGTVVDATATNTAVGDTVSAQTCLSPRGNLHLVAGTNFTL